MGQRPRRRITRPGGRPDRQAAGERELVPSPRCLVAAAVPAWCCLARRLAQRARPPVRSGSPGHAYNLGSRRRRGRGCPTRSPSAPCPRWSRSPATPRLAAGVDARHRRRARASARTSSTRCPTSTTTPATGSRGCRTGSGDRRACRSRTSCSGRRSVVAVLGPAGRRRPRGLGGRSPRWCVVLAGSSRWSAAARRRSTPRWHRAGRRRAAHGGRRMTAWDLAVVGAGPAGAATAIGALRADPALRVRCWTGPTSLGTSPAVTASPRT